MGTDLQYRALRELKQYFAKPQKARMQAAAGVISLQMAREANGSLRRCTTQFPTQGYAQAAGMSLSQYQDFVYQACKVHLPEPVAAWREVEQSQQRLVDYLAGKQHLHVRGQHIDLEMSIEGRTFSNACGTANLPDGEIFTGQVEDSVNGWVRFTYPAYYRETEVSGIRLVFENGVVTQATADKNEAALHSALNTDPGARRLGSSPSAGALTP